MASAEVESDVADGDVVGVTFVFRQRESDAAGGPIVLHVRAGQKLPPASSADQSLVDLGGTRLRWTPGRGQLEWIADGAYISLEGTSDLASMLDLASRFHPVVAEAVP